MWLLWRDIQSACDFVKLLFKSAAAKLFHVTIFPTINHYW
jgi:hypothetical protein